MAYRTLLALNVTNKKDVHVVFIERDLGRRNVLGPFESLWGSISSYKVPLNPPSYPSHSFFLTLVGCNR